MNQLLRKAGMLSLGIIAISSFAGNPNGDFFTDGLAADFNYNTRYLSEEDIAFNLEQLGSSGDGFLIKSMPQDSQAIKIDRVETIDHEVLEGQSLSQIADLYELKTETLIWSNNIVNVDSVKPGQVLKIPPTNGIVHTVQKGETISTILAKYDDSTIDQFRKYNQLQGDVLRIGQEVFIPNGKRITATVIAENIEPINTQPNKVANIETDIDATVEPNYPQPDAIPNVNVPDINGINGTNRTTVDTVDVPVTNTTVNLEPAPTTGTTWIQPTNGLITQGYRAGHYARDIANRSQPPIWATADGVVEKASYGWNGGYGNVIIIDHENGYKTLYAHNQDIYVTAGERVSQGEVISKMGKSGRVYGATGIHLHYECHLNGVRINPAQCM